MKAPIAMYSDGDARRLHKEFRNPKFEVEEYRTQWRRDYARLIHSASFRRLQGKTQLYPGRESDFFRNRLTHSLEVAQIAKSIAIRINSKYKELTNFNINPDIVEIAGLAHDIGHPPFGHQGEEALDECMIEEGGFEGNAQTLRILSKIEKKYSYKFISDDLDGLACECPFITNGVDLRVGINLTSRVYASVLKYNIEIPYAKSQRVAYAKLKNKEVAPVKGYYQTESTLVKNIIKNVVNDANLKLPFKTIECQIMDIADDIAYSTFDLEDGLKAGFFSPYSIVFSNDELLDDIAKNVNKSIETNLNKDDVRDYLFDIFKDSFMPTSIDSSLDAKFIRKNFKYIRNSFSQIDFNKSNLISRNGYYRNELTSKLIGEFIRGIKFQFNDILPMLSEVSLDPEIEIKIEILKKYNYLSQIEKPRLKLVAFRGKEIVKYIFEVLANDGHKLLPDDYLTMYESVAPDLKKRIICDFVSGMTDEYAVKFYSRLKSENPDSIFKPH